MTDEELNAIRERWGDCRDVPPHRVRRILSDVRDLLAEVDQLRAVPTTGEFRIVLCERHRSLRRAELVAKERFRASKAGQPG